jgi:type IV secretory pathway TraG/TraD family ATPase VirD4
MAHCRNSIFFAPGAGELGSAEIISKVCGRESISRANISYSGNRGGIGYGNKSLSDQEQERNLINADEVMKLPLDQFILIVQGQPPYIGKKNVYYEDAIFKKRLYPEAFKTREEALKSARKTIEIINGRHWFDLPEIKASDAGAGEAERTNIGNFVDENLEDITENEDVGCESGESDEESEFPGDSAEMNIA